MWGLSVVWFRHSESGTQQEGETNFREGSGLAVAFVLSETTVGGKRCCHWVFSRRHCSESQT